MGRAAGILLAGGRSSRMGTSKAHLEWHGSTLLRRTAGIVARGVDGPVVVVRAPGQELPALPDDVEVVEDAREGRGPLQGIAAGLAHMRERADVCFVSSVDVPLLHPRFVRRVVEALDAETDVVLPEAQGHRHPLAAAYRTTLLDEVEALIAADRMRPAFLFDRCRVKRLADADLLGDRELARTDPELASLLNLNAPDDYAAARARPAPAVLIERFGALRPRGARAPLAVRAATLAGAAAAADLELNSHVVAAVNGDRISRDPETPLAEGDRVLFMAADAGG
jgi:molybdopterin-guanine dinucleotide biosynthesis protein A